MDYGDLFTRAWRICWNNKYLFLLGFLAALGSGSAGGNQGFQYTFGEEQLPPQVLENADRILAFVGPALATLACLGLILGLVMWLIRLAAQAGLINSAARLDRGETTSLRESFSAGTAHLPRFVGLNILVYLPFWLIGIVVIGLGILAFGASVVTALGGVGGEELGGLPAGFAILGVCAILLFCLLLPLLAVASVIYAFAQRGIVLQDMGVVQSARYAWRFIRENAGEILLLIIFLVVLSLIYGAVVSAILIPLGFLAFGPAVLNLIAGAQMQFVDILFAVVGAIVLGLVGALLNAIFTAFRSVTVTLAFQDLLGKSVEKAAPVMPAA